MAFVGIEGSLLSHTCRSERLRCQAAIWTLIKIHESSGKVGRRVVTRVVGALLRGQECLAAQLA